MATTIACLTPPGKAAIATLAVQGPAAWEITRELFVPRRGSLPEMPVAGRCWLGKLGNDHSDDAILAVKPTLLEIHCHGGVEVVRLLQDLYAERGATIVPWQKFIDNPLLELLVQAPTTRTAAILLDQANGAWARCTAELEPRSETIDSARSRLQRLIDLIPLGKHLIDPWRIVIAGAPNVGKSTLMNALAGYARSIVSPVPGTTRDVVAVRLAIDGWPVELIDTAGIRLSSSDLEEKGILRAHAAARDADMRLWLLDGSAEPVWPEDSAGWHYVVNKIDLPAAWDWQNGPGAIQVSAQTQAGLPALCLMISHSLVPRPPTPGEAVPCLAEQIQWTADWRKHQDVLKNL